MKNVVYFFLIIIFLLLALIHFYWAFGGHWGLENTLPTDKSGTKVLNPKFIDSFIMGIVLSLLSFFYYKIHKTGVVNKIRKILSFVIPSLFLLRAIGDFTYVGFFKSINGTQFSEMDTILYTPLCFLISLLGFYLIYKNKP